MSFQTEPPAMGTPSGAANSDTWVGDNLRMLGRDQEVTEDKVAALERNQKVLAGAILAIGASVVVGYKAVSNLMGAVNKLGQLVVNAPGVVAASVQGGVEEAERQQAAARQPAAHRPFGAPADWQPPPPPSGESLMVDGYDPGFQEVPPEVKAALAAEDNDPEILKGAPGEVT